MKKLLLLSIAGSLLPIPLAMAKDPKVPEWAQKAALEYEQKADEATKAGNRKEAHIYNRMAEIKREAGRSAAQGKEFKWDEYQRLHAELHGGEGPGKHSGQPQGDKEAAHKNREWAEGKRVNPDAGHPGKDNERRGFGERETKPLRDRENPKVDRPNRNPDANPNGEKQAEAADYVE